MDKLLATFKLHKTGQTMSAVLWDKNSSGDESIIKIEWVDKKTGRVIKEAHYHDEVFLLAQTDGFEVGETIVIKIKEKDGKEFEKGVYELMLFGKVAEDSSVRFEVPIPTTMQEGTLYVDEIECDTSFRDVTLKIEECVCRDWGTIAPVIKVSQHVNWSTAYTDDPSRCYKLATLQLTKVGYSPSGKSYQIAKIVKENGVEKISYVKDSFKQAVNYLKTALKNNTPVMCGVERKTGSSSNDGISDHFIVIVGMGTDEKGNYFLFYDNAVTNTKIGTSLDNKLYCYCKEHKIEGVGDDRNTYILSEISYKKYILSRVIESIKNKK